MRATGDLQPDAVPAPERVRDGPEIKLDGRGVSGATSVRRTFVPEMLMIGRAG
jgi:hypothetical protein